MPKGKANLLERKERQLARQVRIPKAFTLGGTRITTEYKAQVDEHNTLAGAACYDDQKVVLLSTMVGDHREQVFCHELVHHILHKMGESKLRGNEQFVDVFSTFLHQYLKTAEY